MEDIETLKKMCFAIESEWGEKEADKYFSAVFRLEEDLDDYIILLKVYRLMKEKIIKEPSRYSDLLNYFDEEWIGENIK